MNSSDLFVRVTFLESELELANVRIRELEKQLEEKKKSRSKPKSALASKKVGKKIPVIF